MKSILSAVAILVPALGLVTGCNREPNQPASSVQQNVDDQYVEDAKRRNEDLRRLNESRKEEARSNLILETLKQTEKLTNARRDKQNARRKFNGKWVAIAHTSDGTEIPADTLEAVPWYWIVDDAKLLSKRPGSDGKTIHEEKIDIDVDPDKIPQTIDLINQEKKETSKGIYVFDENTLEVCFAMNSDGDRPGDFTAKKDSKRSLMVWKRVKK